MAKFTSTRVCSVPPSPNIPDASRMQAYANTGTDITVEGSKGKATIYVRDPCLVRPPAPT